MKSFYGVPDDALSSISDASPMPGEVGMHAVSHAPEPLPQHSYIGTRARVAVYDARACAPYVEDVGPAPAREYIESLSTRVYELARQRGGPIPFTVVREIVENFVHAGFAEPVVSVLDDGCTIRFSDQGPGIPDKERAVQPGFTTATSAMKSVIRGVGSGLPLVNDFLTVTGGRLSIEDNLSRGAVITVSTRNLPAPPAEAPSLASTDRPRANDSSSLDLFDSPEPLRAVSLTNRQKQVLALVLESGSAGPSIVSRELGVGLSTAYRDLASLEELGLISAESGKRALTPSGLAYLGEMSTSS